MSRGDVRYGLGVQGDDRPDRRGSQCEYLVVAEPPTGETESQHGRDQVENDVRQVKTRRRIAPDLAIDPERQERERPIVGVLSAAWQIGLDRLHEEAQYGSKTGEAWVLDDQKHIVQYERS